MRRAQSGAIFDDGAGLAGGVFTDAPAKTVISGRCMLAGAKPVPSGAAGNTVGQDGVKPCKGKPFDVTNQLELEGQKGNPV
jgi:hypothetical protein